MLEETRLLEELKLLVVMKTLAHEFVQIQK